MIKSLCSWLDCVTRAFDYFIADKRHHDHWLSYCSNELIIYKSKKNYCCFAVDNMAGYSEFSIKAIQWDWDKFFAASVCVGTARKENLDLFHLDI